jgi:hypothetical protein
MSNKKIALCLSGKATSSMFCFPYIYDAFLNNDLNVDVFVHTWNECRILDLYNPKKVEIEQYDSKDILNHFLSNLILPANIQIQGNVHNVLLEYYGNKKVFDLVDDTYDYVIRCRFDVIIQDKFNLSEIIDDLNSDKYDMFSPDEVFNFGGYQNRIFLGKYWVMKEAMGLIEDVNILANNLNRWHPESFLKTHLDSKNVRVFQKDINHRIVRSSSIVTNWPENPFKFLDL